MTEEIIDVHATTPHYDRVEKFMRLANQTVRDQPSRMTDNERLLRARLIMEETLELIGKGLGIRVSVEYAGSDYVEMIEEDDISYKIVGEQNNVEIADGFADLSVVSVGTMIAAGIKDAAILLEVDNNNLAKFGPGHSFRPDGKLIKPPGHVKPDIFGIVSAQIKS